MRKLFPGSYPLKEADFAHIWAEGIFVFDTSMLLNFHRYSEKARKEFLGIVSSPELSSRIWIPYQVAVEYHRNLDNVRYEPISALNEVKQAIVKSGQGVRVGDHKTRVESLLKVVDQLVADAEEQYRHPDRWSLVEQIADLFEGKVGPEWDFERLKKVYKEGEERYARKIPPGFKDVSTKKGDDRYGDLVIWCQIIEHAANEKKPILLVTDDLKDDWWLRNGAGETIGPQPDLANEIHRKAGVPFYMYSGDKFLEHARTALKRDVRDETVAEVKKVREEQQPRHAALLASEVDTARFLQALRQALVENWAPNPLLHHSSVWHRNSLLDHLRRQRSWGSPGSSWGFSPSHASFLSESFLAEASTRLREMSPEEREALLREWLHELPQMGESPPVERVDPPPSSPPETDDDSTPKKKPGDKKNPDES